MTRLLSRSLLLAAAATGALAASAQADPLRSYRSRPDLRPPKVFVTQRSAGVAPGDIFLTPRPRPGGRSGPMILDANGNLVWWAPRGRGRAAIDLKPQTYLGQPVLTWIERPAITGANIYTGTPQDTYAVVVDSRYHVLHRVHAVGRGVVTDLHDFVLLPNGHALLLGFRVIPGDLRPAGGPRHGRIVENLVQVVDVKTNKLLFDWHGLTHIRLTESMVPAPKDGRTPYDYTHFNSVALDRDGNIIVSARHTSTVYKISRRDGHIIWRLGGKRNDFKLGPDVRFYYQHDARPQPDGTYTIFDNHAAEFDVRAWARGMQVRLSHRRATLVHEYGHGLLVASQGNLEALPNGNRFVGWGNSPYFSEFALDGRRIFDGHLYSQRFQSYRAFKGVWHARPDNGPNVFAHRVGGLLGVYASWNGATDIARWRLMGGPQRTGLTQIAEIPATEFEAHFQLPSSVNWVKVWALDSAGHRMGRSREVQVKNG